MRITMFDLPKPKFKHGDTVLVKKGAIVRTTHPKRNHYILKRNQTTKVNHTLTPYFVTKYEYERYHIDKFPNAKMIKDEYNTEYYILHNNIVVWVGTGSYWCETEEDNCVLEGDTK